MYTLLTRRLVLLAILALASLSSALTAHAATAAEQLEYASRGIPQADHVFDGTKRP
jgi:ABC-type nitrate/sulfonate/bicarbonate transport system substrate-binding protein